MAEFTTVPLAGTPVDERGHNFLHGRPVAGFVTLSKGHSLEFAAPHLTNAFECSACGRYPTFDISADEQGDFQLTARDKCPSPAGFDITYDLAVPSGRMVVADDLRPCYDVDQVHFPTLNSCAGRIERTKLMLKAGCAWGITSDGGGDLVRVAEGRYVIASYDDEAEPGEEGYLAGDQLARISFAVWSFTVADHDDLQARIAAYDGQHDGRVERVMSVVEVPAGTYRFRVHTARADFDEADAWPEVYADIEYLGPDVEANSTVTATPAVPR